MTRLEQCKQMESLARDILELQGEYREAINTIKLARQHPLQHPFVKIWEYEERAEKLLLDIDVKANKYEILKGICPEN